LLLSNKIFIKAFYLLIVNKRIGYNINSKRYLGI
jgi:hypothetical protein